ncbi:SulP family inorganic anion transporter [Subsaximicrobium wynnwilliamsii]|uniref:SulP family inorganic anion transporter n=1 Tax=Subsaximicrobium wynnwilliamsii TaxID=291179 RepID=A0A5C6ZHR5_9FLAO|nr:SulP family inorganic anion transporter [Subsaximicrobium wynnwilliamsii]TXD82719.1 SulP family inorganic anion transporter [Subsaximicrobium wynnwilliamsii]TXD88454.1 SulP family inorganic anion transporter [Subsaximicrobium wynnwilliamsii]TXE02381.1 SulP family inorganic anion transporter [Subsaximicrobium wynnwilliamsii]
MFKTLKSDFPASVVVFFVALPLCLGIALASGAPLFSGLIAGIIGGIVVGALSGSKVGVSGPAAGLAAIVLTAIGTLGGYENFLVAVVLGGVIQLVFGILKAGIIGYYFPSSVIKGMLTGIGIIIILKQIPNFFGYDEKSAWDLGFFENDGGNTFSEILAIVNNITPGAALIGIVSLLLLILWDKVLTKKSKVFQIIQGPFVVVVLGILFYTITQNSETLFLGEKHMVNVPIPDDIQSFMGQFSFPNFAVITNMEVWIVAFTIALVASLETLLCVEATDKIDPEKNVTPTNRELLAQGTGNILSGLIGGLPITQVIVRSSANIQSGGKSKLSPILHGFLLLIAVVLIPRLLNMIPLSVLAAILLVVGYKLAKPALFKKMYKLGWKQSVPFAVTVGGIVFTDLLIGIGLGLGVGIVVILIKSYQNSHFLHVEDKSNGKHKIKMTLAEEVTFFNKGAILKELDSLPRDSYLEFDVTKTRYLDHDIIEILEDFAFKAKERNIDIKLISKRGVIENPESFTEFFKLRPKSKISLS